MGQNSRIRLYVDGPLQAGQVVNLSKGQSHYLGNVMRRGSGDQVLLFNGHDGEWTADIGTAGKRSLTATCGAKVRVQTAPPDLWLLFAPIRKARTEMLVEKATELGVSRLMPVITDFTNSESLRLDRLNAIVIEGAEQSERLEVPAIDPPQQLGKVLKALPSERVLVFADELARDRNARISPGPAAILIGPEGGFSERERTMIRGVSGCQAVSLGPRILRAETAAIAALTLYQSTAGDWA